MNILLQAKILNNLQRLFEKLSSQIGWPSNLLIAFDVLVSAQGDHLVSIKSVPSGPCLHVLIPSDLCHFPG